MKYVQITNAFPLSKLTQKDMLKFTSKKSFISDKVKTENEPNLTSGKH